METKLKKKREAHVCKEVSQSKNRKYTKIRFSLWKRPRENATFWREYDDVVNKSYKRYAQRLDTLSEMQVLESWTNPSKNESRRHIVRDTKWCWTSQTGSPVTIGGYVSRRRTSKGENSGGVLERPRTWTRKEDWVAQQNGDVVRERNVLRV